MANNEQSNIAAGSWFCSTEGIAWAEAVLDYYYEEYDCIPQDKTIGDYKWSVVLYKVFCDYEGKIKKRNIFHYFKADCCSSLSSKWKRVLDKCITANPEDYSLFERKTFPTDVCDCVVAHFSIPEELQEKIDAVLSNLKNQLPSLFTFKQLQQMLAHNSIRLDCNNVVSDAFYEKSVLRLYLKYNMVFQKVKEIEFNSLDYKLIK